jgi:predicted enzyme related to lactoylglutathione lyase
MKKFTLMGLLCAAFLLGYGFSRVTHPVNSGPRVTGIGGIFFKAKDPKALRAWYGKNLCIRMSDYGSTFEWHQGMDSTKKGFTSWALFKESTKYFAPSDKPFMINYRVEGLDQLLATMKTAGILPVDSVQRTSGGNFVHLMDPEGNKIELWEPAGVEHTPQGIVTTK